MWKWAEAREEHVILVEQETRSNYKTGYMIYSPVAVVSSSQLSKLFPRHKVHFTHRRSFLKQHVPYLA